MVHNHQQFDSALKLLFEGQAVEVIANLISGVEVEEELRNDALKPPLRTDLVYRAKYRGKACILHSELETGANSGMAYRMLEYYGILLKKYRKPIISVIIYPFRTSIPESPLRVAVGEEEVLVFHFWVIVLWELDARDYLDRHAVAMYALLPTMQNATYHVLRRALDEMKERYGDDKRRLAEHLLLFDTFLRRSDMVEPEDKEKVGEYLDMFESLLEESRFVRKKAAEAKEEGRVQGAIDALQQTVVDIVRLRYPALEGATRQSVEHMRDQSILRHLITQIMASPDEKTTRVILGLTIS